MTLSLSPSQRRPSASASTSGSRQTRLNENLAIFLCGFVALAPVPLGGSRPLFWAISGLIIGLAAVVYCIALWRKGERFRVGVGSVAALISLWLALLGFLILQALPLGQIAGQFEIVGIEGQTFYSDYLSVAPGQTLLMALRMASYGCFFFLALQAASNRDRALRMAKWLVFIVAAHGLYGLLALTQFGDVLLFVQKWAYLGSATGTFVNRNSYATFLAFGLVLASAVGLRTLLNTRASHLQKGQRSKLFEATPYFVAALIILSALYATQSRMGLFAGLCGTIFVVLIGMFKSRMQAQGLVVVVLAVLGTLLAVGTLLFSGGTFERLGSVERDSDVRIQLYAQVLDMIQKRWLTGFGGGSFEIAYTLFHREPVSPDLVWDRAHSTYLSLWSELGVFFGTVPMLLYAVMAISAFRLIVTRNSDWWLALIAVGCLLVAALHSVVDFSLEISGNVYLLLMITALGLAQQRQQKRQD